MERQILFSAPMVRAIIEGRKTQTRRVAPILSLDIKQHNDDMVTWGVKFTKPLKGSLGSYSGGRFSDHEARSIIASQFCPYGHPGDRLWVREAFAIVPRTAYASSEGVQQTLRPDDEYEHDAAIYREGWCRSTGGFRWRPSIHMPRWASRILLEVVSVRVERLNDISEADARAEGARSADPVTGRECILDPSLGSYRLHYRDIWEQINGPGSWEANPWVWVVEFKRI